MAIRRAAKNLILVRRVNKRTADKYLPNPANINHEMVVNAKMDRALLTQEGYEVIGRCDQKGNLLDQPQPTPQPIPQPTPQATAQAAYTADELAERSRDEVKDIADALGISYAKNIGTAKLIEKITNGQG